MSLHVYCSHQIGLAGICTYMCKVKPLCAIYHYYCALYRVLYLMNYLEEFFWYFSCELDEALHLPRIMDKGRDWMLTKDRVAGKVTKRVIRILAKCRVPSSTVITPTWTLRLFLLQGSCPDYMILQYMSSTPNLNRTLTLMNRMCSCVISCTSNPVTHFQEWMGISQFWLSE